MPFRNPKLLNATIAIVVIMAVFALTTSVAAVLRANRESQARCEQVHKLTDAVEGIVKFVDTPNPARTAQQQQAIDEFLNTAHDLLDHARPC